MNLFIRSRSKTGNTLLGVGLLFTAPLTLAGKLIRAIKPFVEIQPAKKFFHALKVLVFLTLAIPTFGQNADWAELQGKIDSAVKTGLPVQVNRNYTIDQPLVIAAWNGKDYGTASIKMIGNAMMWDNMNRSVIRATFKDAPILAIHKNKGTVISGITFIGPGVDGRDSRYSPAACIAIDPFCYKLPPDGGYPSLKEWYRGSTSVGGSTGIRIEDCTVKDMLIGIIISPNGYTRNAEMLTFQNIRFGNAKYGFAGCQDQEKMNRIINVGAWEKCETLFVFGLYGYGKPGHYSIDGVNVAGGVRSLIYRHSGGYFPLYMTNVYAESIDSIGTWTTSVGDVLSNATIGLNQYSVTDNQLFGWGLTIEKSNIRYYGQDRRLLFRCRDCKINGGVINALNTYYEYAKGELITANIQDGKITIRANSKVGSSVIFVEGGMSYPGTGVVEKVIGDSVVVRVSSGIVNGKKYSIAK